MDRQCSDRHLCQAYSRCLPRGRRHRLGHNAETEERCNGDAICHLGVPLVSSSQQLVIDVSCNPQLTRQRACIVSIINKKVREHIYSLVHPCRGTCMSSSTKQINIKDAEPVIILQISRNGKYIILIHGFLHSVELNGSTRV